MTVAFPFNLDFNLYQAVFFIKGKTAMKHLKMLSADIFTLG